MARIPELPQPGADVVLHSHATGYLVVELICGAVAVAVAVDAVRRGASVLAFLALVAAAALIGGSLAAWNRTTRTGPEGLEIRRWRHRQVIVWSSVEGFELLPHRWGRVDRIGVRVDGEVIPLVHPDSKNLALRPAASRQWYLELIDRLEALRRKHAVPGL